MIASKNDLKDYLDADRIALGYGGVESHPILI